MPLAPFRLGGPLHFNLREDLAVRVLGAGLAFVHALTAYFWYVRDFLRALAPDNPWPICYPAWPACAEWFQVSPQVAGPLMLVYGLTAGLIVLLFFFPNRMRVAVSGLILLTAFKFFVYFTRFTFVGNYHVMHLVATLSFLFTTDRLAAHRWWLCVFYFCAGTLKLGLEWMSGAALLLPGVLPLNFHILGQAYAVVMELVLIWGLLSQKTWLRRITLAQVVIFHAYSWTIVGYFYPLSMFALIAPLIANEFANRPEPRLRPSRGTILAISAFLLFNFYPRLAGFDPALQGNWRGLRLNMLDVRPRCRALVMFEAQTDQGTNSRMLQLPPPPTALRTQCDPTVYASHVRRLCRELAPASGTLRLAIYSRRATEHTFTLIKEDGDACRNFFDP